MSPLYHSLHYVPHREKECLWLIYIHLLLANRSCFSVNQSNDLVITIDTFHWLYLSKSPLNQSEALLNENRSALLECSIDVFNSVSLCAPFLF